MFKQGNQHTRRIDNLQREVEMRALKKAAEAQMNSPEHQARTQAILAAKGPVPEALQPEPITTKALAHLEPSAKAKDRNALMNWETEIAGSVPGGRKLGRAINKLCDKITLDLADSDPALAAKVLDSIAKIHHNVLNLVGRIKAEQEKKPPQVNTQINVSRGGFSFGRGGGREAECPPRSLTVPAKTVPSLPASPASEPGPTPTSQ